MIFETLEREIEALPIRAPATEPDCHHAAWFLALGGFSIVYALSAMGVLPVLRFLPVENEWTFGYVAGRYAMGYYGYVLNAVAGMALFYVPGRFFHFKEKARIAAVYFSGASVALSFLILVIHEIKRWF